MRPLPAGASEIVKARERGLRPAASVVVSLCGRVGFGNPQVRVFAPSHDWSFMAGLDAIVCVNPASKFVRETLDGLARPVERMLVWDVERQVGMDLWPVWKGVNVPELHTIPLSDRRDAVFVRWQTIRWLPSENRQFACN